MSAFEDMRLLKDEEKSLIQLQNNLKDQLNRLKIEELALISEIRKEKIRNVTNGISSDTPMQSVTENKVIMEEEEHINSQSLDLDVKQFFLNTQDTNLTSTVSVEEEEEMEEENENEDNYQDQLTYFSFN